MHYTECAQADIPLMLIGGASLFNLFGWLRERHKESLILAAVLMAGALFCKQEGQIEFAAHVAGAALSILIASRAGERKKLIGQLGLYLLIAGVLIAPWIIYRSTIPLAAWQMGGEATSKMRWDQAPVLLDAIIANCLHWYNGVGLPKWNIFWPLVGAFVLLSRSTRQYPWNCLLAIFIAHGAVVGLTFLCWAGKIGDNEFGYERFTLIMLPPLWLVFAQCVQEWWSVWKIPAKAGPAARQPA